MASAINNPTSFSVYTNYTNSSNALGKSMGRLSSGIKTAADDAAGVSISENMRSDVRANAMARQNTENAISALTTADSWMQNVNDMLGRMKELAIEAGDGTMSSNDRTNLGKEFSALQAEIDDIIKNKAQFNGANLLSGQFDFATQVGSESGQVITVSLTDMTQTSMLGSATSTSNTKVDTMTNAGIALNTIDAAINKVTGERADIGALQNRFEFTRSGLLSYEDNLRSAESKIRDVDMAREAANMNKYQVLSQVGNAMMAQANGLSQGVLQLVG